MKNEIPYITIVLILISKGYPLNSSYKLMQFIERKLKVIESDKILEKIEQEKYVKFDIINGVHYYILNPRGKQFINNNHNWARVFLVKKYMEEEEIIDTLFSSYNNR